MIVKVSIVSLYVGACKDLTLHFDWYKLITLLKNQHVFLLMLRLLSNMRHYVIRYIKWWRPLQRKPMKTLHAERSETERTREEQTQALSLYDFNNCNALVMTMMMMMVWPHFWSVWPLMLNFYQNTTDSFVYVFFLVKRTFHLIILQTLCECYF